MLCKLPHTQSWATVSVTGTWQQAACSCKRLCIAKASSTDHRHFATSCMLMQAMMHCKGFTHGCFTGLLLMPQSLARRFKAHRKSNLGSSHARAAKPKRRGQGHHYRAGAAHSIPFTYTAVHCHMLGHPSVDARVLRKPKANVRDQIGNEVGHMGRILQLLKPFIILPGLLVVDEGHGNSLGRSLYTGTKHFKGHANRLEHKACQLMNTVGLRLQPSCKALSHSRPERSLEESFGRG